MSVVGGDRTVATGGLAASPLDTAADDGGEVTEVLAAILGFGLGFGLGGVELELRMKGLSATTEEVPFRSVHWTLRQRGRDRDKQYHQAFKLELDIEYTGDKSQLFIGQVFRTLGPSSPFSCSPTLSSSVFCSPFEWPLLGTFPPSGEDAAASAAPSFLDGLSDSGASCVDYFRLYKYSYTD